MQQTWYAIYITAKLLRSLIEVEDDHARYKQFLNENKRTDFTRQFLCKSATELRCQIAFKMEFENNELQHEQAGVKSQWLLKIYFKRHLKSINLRRVSMRRNN